MHYAMSDIHGHYREYKEMLEKINFSEDDTLYIIGDIIDKGSASGKLLKEILEDSRVIPLLGNHEMMMVDSIKGDEFEHRWFCNEGYNTIMQLADCGIDYLDLIPLVQNLPVVIPKVEVGTHTFYMTHASPIRENTSDTVFWTQENDVQVFYSIWDRKYGIDGTTQWWSSNFPDRILLIGHTPNYYSAYSRKDSDEKPLISVDKQVVNLDCGCAGNRRLGCMRLEDFQEYYVDCYPRNLSTTTS